MLIGTATLYTNYFTAYDFASNVKDWISATTSGGGAAFGHAMDPLSVLPDTELFVSRLS